MTACRAGVLRCNGWPADEARFEVVGGGLTATVVPGRGAKIVSLVDRRGVQWLGQPDHPVGPPARAGADFLGSEMSGWDECAPTIVACEVGGVALADHGDLWTMPFKTRDATVSVRDPSLDYTFERTLVADDSCLRLDYRVTALSHPIPFLWAAHPQLCAPDGSRVLLPASVDTVVDVVDPALPAIPWSAALGSIDTVTVGGYRKLYVHPDQHASHAALVHPDGGTLHMSWSQECPFLGVWFDRSAYRADPVIALEPTTAYFDSLDTAVQNGRHPTVTPGFPLTWTVRLSVLG